MFVFFGEALAAELVYALLGVLAISLLFLNLRTVLLLALIFLTLPSLDTPLAGVSRLLRWAFLAALLGKGLLGNVRGGFAPRPSTREHSVVLILCGLCIVSAAWSIGSGVTLAQGLMMVTLLVGVYLVLWNSWGSEEDILGLCNTLFILAVLIFTLEGIYLAIGMGMHHGSDRYSGVFLNPNGLGTAVAFLGPFVYWKHLTSPSPLAKIYCKGLAVVMLISLLESGSRSGFLGTVLCVGIIACYVYRVKIAVLLALLTIPLALLLLIGRDLDTSALMESRLVRADTITNLSDRLPLWGEGLDLFLNKPLTGHGYGMSKFANLGRADFDMAKAVFRMRGVNYHSAHLQIALDLGLVGLSLFLFFIASVLMRGMELYREGRNDPLHLAGIVFFAAYFAMAGDTFVHGWAFSPGSSMAIVFWLMAAATMRVHLLSADAREAEAEEEEEAESALQESLDLLRREPAVVE